MKMLTLSFVLVMSVANASDFGITKDTPTLELPNAENFTNIRMYQAGSFDKSSLDFPSKNVRAYDPVNKKHYSKAVAGKTFKASIFRGYDYWRYVTVYNVETSAERVSYLPYFEESCHDSSFFMAQWGETRTFKVSMTSTVGAEVGIDGLGFSSSISMSVEQGVSFTSSRRVQAVKGIEAKHFPYKLSDTLSGVTYIQTYDESSGTYGYLLPSYYDEWFGEYPYGFGLDNQNVGFKVKREVTKKCASYDPSDDPVTADELYLKGQYIREE